MAGKKIKDLCVKTGSYTDRTGTEKANWANIGAVFQGDDNKKWILLNRDFNPAGVPYKEGGNSIIVSMFDPKEKDGTGAAPKAAAPAAAPAAGKGGSFDDDIPFSRIGDFQY